MRGAQGQEGDQGRKDDNQYESANKNLIRCHS